MEHFPLVFWFEINYCRYLRQKPDDFEGLVVLWFCGEAMSRENTNPFIISKPLHLLWSHDDFLCYPPIQ